MFIIAILLAILAWLFLSPIVTYNRDSKHLRHFPAPSCAAVTSFWRIWKNIKYQHYLAIHEAHQELGTHIRIAPNHVSISDTTAVNEIYGHGANFLKDAWYDGGAGEFRHMADSRIKSEHQGKRKKLAHIFSPKAINSLEPVIADTVCTLVAQVQKHALENQPINMRRYLNYFTIDVFSRLLYGETQGCLTRGDDTVDAETKDGRVYQVPFIKSLHDATVINTVLGMEAGLLPITKKLFQWHLYKKAGANWDNMIYHKTKKRLRDEGARDDIFSRLLENKMGEPLDLPVGELLAECSVMMNAGTDTTTAALTNTIYLIYKNPKALARLREELDENAGSCERPTYEQLAQLPYLRACVEEALRVRPASSMGLPRTVPEGGRTIAGKFIEEGVTVSIPTYTTLRDPQTFKDAEAFLPERWLTSDKEEKERMLKVHLPFSTGPRACIGRNIAYLEQLLVIAALVKGFDFEFESPDFELQVFERFNSNPGELMVKCKNRIIV